MRIQVKTISNSEGQDFMPFKIPVPVPKHRAMKAYKGSRGKAQNILHFKTIWIHVVSVNLQHFYLKKKSPLSHWVRGWVGTRKSLCRVAKRIISVPA